MAYINGNEIFFSPIVSVGNDALFLGLDDGTEYPVTMVLDKGSLLIKPSLQCTNLIGGNAMRKGNVYYALYTSVSAHDGYNISVSGCEYVKLVDADKYCLFLLFNPKEDVKVVIQFS